MWISKELSEVLVLYIVVIQTIIISTSLFFQNTQPVGGDPTLFDNNNFSVADCNFSITGAPTPGIVDDKRFDPFESCLSASIEGDIRHLRCETNMLPKIIIATKKGNIDVILRELHNGVLVDTVDAEGQSALFWASCRGNGDLTRFLISKGANVDHRVNWDSTPLHASADRGHLNCVEILLSNGANVNAQNRNQDTPLHLAAYRGNYQVSILLLAHNANLNLENFKGKTPYQEAKEAGHSKIVRLLTTTNRGSTYPLENNSSLGDLYKAKCNYDVDSFHEREAAPTQNYKISSLSLTGPVDMNGACGLSGHHSYPGEQRTMSTFPLGHAGATAAHEMDDGVYNMSTVVPIHRTYSNGMSTPRQPYHGDLLHHTNGCSPLATQHLRVPERNEGDAFQSLQLRLRKSESVNCNLREELFCLRREMESLRREEELRAERSSAGNLVAVERQEAVIRNLREDVDKECSLRLAAEARSRQAVRDVFALRSQLGGQPSPDRDWQRPPPTTTTTGHSVTLANAISKSFDKVTAS